MALKHVSMLTLLTIFAQLDSAKAGDSNTATENHAVIEGPSIETNDQALAAIEPAQEPQSNLHAVVTEPMPEAQSNLHAAVTEPMPEAQTNLRPALKKTASGKVHWGYTGATGPENWGDLSVDYDMCKIGREQSPIDLKKNVNLIKNPFSVDYKKTPLDIVDNGHTIKQTVQGENILTYEGEDYTLLQFHYHTSSEHTVEGRSYPMEVHLVHQNKRGGYLVVGLLVEPGEENEVFSKIIQANKNNSSGGADIDLNALYKKANETYHYLGSFTIPPCTEGVEWFVVKHPIRLSKQQIKFLSNIHPHNNRPVQEYLSY